MVMMGQMETQDLLVHQQDLGHLLQPQVLLVFLHPVLIRQKYLLLLYQQEQQVQQDQPVQQEKQVAQDLPVQQDQRDQQV
jgi:hypothetical protein